MDRAPLKKERRTRVRVQEIPGSSANNSRSHSTECFHFHGREKPGTLLATVTRQGNSKRAMEREQAIPQYVQQIRRNTRGESSKLLAGFSPLPTFHEHFRAHFSTSKFSLGTWARGAAWRGVHLRASVTTSLTDLAQPLRNASAFRGRPLYRNAYVSRGAHAPRDPRFPSICTCREGTRRLRLGYRQGRYEQLKDDNVHGEISSTDAAR